MQHAIPERAGPQGSCGLLRRLPVPQHHVRAPDDQLADDSRRDALPLLVHDPRVDVGHRVADRRRPLVDLIRRQIGDARALRQPVHGENPRPGELLPQLPDVLDRKRRAGAAQVPHAGEIVPRQIRLQHQCGHGRHDREAGGPFTADLFQDHVREGERPFQHHRRAHLERDQHLVEPVAERQRQHVEDDVVRGILEVGGDGRGRRHDIPVRQHHPLGPAGRPRGVDQGREVFVDALAGGPRARELGGLQNCVQRDAFLPRLLGAGAGAADDVHAAQVGRARPAVLDGTELLDVRHHDRGAAIVEDVGELVGLGGGVDQHERAVGLESREHRDDRLG